MSILTFSFPKLKNITFNFSQLNQVVGDNTELKQLLWQVLLWYLSKHKYNEAELSALDYREPEILLDGNILPRTAFKTIVIESISDVHELLKVKKGTPVYSILQNITNNIEISENIEIINEQLEKMKAKLNDSSILKQINGMLSISWKTEIAYLTASEILQKKVSMEVFNNNHKSAIEYESALIKYRVLINFLRNKLLINVEPTLLMIKNIDNSLNQQDFNYIMEEINKLTNDFPHFYCIIFPSQIGYVYINEISIENILVIGEYSYMLESGEDLYKSICNHYPDNNVPTYSMFLKQMQVITPYLFSNIQEANYLSIKNQILIKIINELYFFYDFKPINVDKITSNEYKFLYKKSRD
jgi:hypothetical protein